MADGDKPTFTFLPDFPVADDKFGSHGQVAKSIADEVESNTPGMSIGLEGTWGSGKSSVIRMLEERWKDRKDIKVFTFDAWAHEGDSLRRSFLEEMITFLQRVDGDSDRWLSPMIRSCDRPRSDCSDCADRSTCRPDLIREALRHRREDSTIESEPKITPWGIWFAVATLVMPIGVALLSGARNLTDWFFYLGTFAAAAPLLWILVFIVHRWVTKQGQDGYLAVIVGKTKDITTHTTHRGIDPSSIEFGEYYSEILSACLTDEDNRRLVIVLDNLDRVGEDAALKAWATMRTFLRPGNAVDGDFRKNIWLIVPYDPGAIEHLLSRSDGDERRNVPKQNQDEPHNVPEQNQEVMEAELARAFKEKTFQIRYRVAPPLASRWEEYFKACVEEAFPGQKENVQHAIYHIFRIQGLPAYNRGTPTPREMKLFINRMVALAQQHHPDVPLPEIALYTAVELSERTLLENLAETDFKKEKYFTDFLTPDWQEGLAAIHFGVPRQDAAEVLYGPKIRDVLRDGNADAMQELLATVPAQQCCERYLRDKAIEMDFSEVLEASRAFGKFTSQSASPGLARAIGRLAHRLGSIDEDAWAIDGKLTSATAVDIVRLLRFKPKIGSAIAGCLCVRMPDASKASILEANLPAWAAGASVVVAELAKGNDFRGITVEMPDPARYQALLDLLANDTDGQKVIRFFQPVSDMRDAYGDHIFSQVQGGAFRKEDTHILTGMLQMSCWNPREVGGAVSQAVLKCLSQDNVNKDVLCRAVKFLLEQAAVKGTDPAFTDVLKKYGASAHVCMALHQHQAHPETAALCVTLLLLHNPNPDCPAGHAGCQGKQQYEKVLAGTNQNIAQAMAHVCIEYDLVDRMLDTIQTNRLEDKQFIPILLSELASPDDEQKALTTTTFIKHHRLFLATLDKKGDEDTPSPYDELVNRLLRAREDNLLTTLESNKMAPGLMRPCYLAINAEDLDTGRLEERLREYFSRDVQQDQWLKELSEGSCTLDVMLLLRQK